MSRYIDAEKIEEVIRKKVPLKYLMANSYGRAKSNGTRIAEILYDNIPTADVVEVVRFKDCKYFMFSDFCCGHLEVVNPYDFCSHGERKNGGD